MKGRIVRAPKERDFVRINNSVARDLRLTWAARGILAYLLSKPDDWQANTWDLVQNGPSGADAVRARLRELEELGYLRRKRIRNEDGTYGWFTTVYEDPGMANEVDVDLNGEDIGEDLAG